jgi:chromosomal replication initiation ATPase DnaA
MAQLILPLEMAGALGRDDFIVAPGNARAVAFVDAWPDWSAPAAVLVGPPACGKSHLAGVWARKAGAHILSAGNLRDVPAFLIPEGALVVEDVAAGVAEVSLFALLERGTPLLLTSQLSPAQWPVTLPDLVSRTRALLAFTLWAPDEALLMGLAVKLFADRQVSVPEAVVSAMVRSLERAPGAIRDFVARADALALAEKRPINLNLIKGLLAGPPPPGLF